MATKRRSIVKDNALWFPGMSIIADSITLDNAAVLSVTFPAKTVLAVIAQSHLDTDATKVVTAWTITNGVATVTFTKATTGAFSYIILYTITETQTSPLTVTTSTTHTPIA